MYRLSVRTCVRIVSFLSVRPRTDRLTQDCFIDRLKEEEEKNTTQVSSKQESN
jgi:hypothetical protein